MSTFWELGEGKQADQRLFEGSETGVHDLIMLGKGPNASVKPLECTDPRVSRHVSRTLWVLRYATANSSVTL